MTDGTFDTQDPDWLPPQASWPSLPSDVVLSAKRIDVDGHQHMWIMGKGEFGYHLMATSKPLGDEWPPVSAGATYASIKEAVQSDHDLVSLRAAEATVYRLHGSVEMWPSDLAASLTCVGLESPPRTGWPESVREFWTKNDDELDGLSPYYSCTPRWASIDDQRILCIEFDDVTPMELIPALFDDMGELDPMLEVAHIGYDEGDEDFGRPVSFAGGYSLRKLRPGYAIYMTTGDGEQGLDPALVRLPLDPDEERVAIAAFQAELEFNHSVGPDD